MRASPSAVGFVRRTDDVRHADVLSRRIGTQCWKLSRRAGGREAVVLLEELDHPLLLAQDRLPLRLRRVRGQDEVDLLRRQRAAHRLRRDARRDELVEGPWKVGSAEPSCRPKSARWHAFHVRSFACASVRLAIVSTSDIAYAHDGGPRTSASTRSARLARLRARRLGDALAPLAARSASRSEPDRRVARFARFRFRVRRSSTL